jgi:hypothetical protein
MLKGPYGLISGTPQPEVAVHVQVSIWSVVTFWDQTSGLLGAGTGRGLRLRVMVSFEASRSARGAGWPLEVVFERVVLVVALVSFVVVSRVGELGAGRTAAGAIMQVGEVE